MGARFSTVGPTKQLSELQQYILVWLQLKEEFMYELEDEKAIRELNNKGVPWRVSDLFGDKPKNASVNVSKSLKRLQDRGLLTLSDSSEGMGKKPRTSHVKLTAQGRTLATIYTLETGGLLPNLTYEETYSVLGVELDKIDPKYRMKAYFARQNMQIICRL
jgi:hypothetical protein